METEEITTTEETKTVDPLNALSSKISEGIREKEEALYDPTTDYTGPSAEQTSTTEASGEIQDGKSSYQKIKEELELSRRENQRLRETGQMDAAVAYVEKNYPNARESRISGALRREVPPEHLKNIARGSHEDYMRGALDTEKKYEAEIAKIRTSATAEAETQTAANWGSAPESNVSAGEGTVSPEEFEKAVRSRKLNDSQLAQMEARVKWTQF